MKIKSYVIDKGEGKFSIVSGDLDDPGFANFLKDKKYQEKPEGYLVSDDPRGEFSKAYEFHNGKFFVNMEKAKDLYLDLLKKIREEKFEELDKEMLIALGSQDAEKIKKIEEQKQALRDFPDLLPSNSPEKWKKIETLYDLVHIFPPCLQ